MNNPRFSSLRGFAPDNEQVQPISLPIPPPPLPPRFPPTNIPPPPFPPFLHPPTFFPPQPQHRPTHNSISTLPTHTFQSNTAQSVAAAKWAARSDPAPEHLYSSLADGGSQEMLNHWLQSKKRPVSAKKPNNNVKIYYVKGKLNAAHNLIRELDNDARTLNVMVKAVGTSEWNQKCNEIELKKTELLNIFNELKFNKEDLDQIKEKSLKRSKKRARLRRQALRRKKQKENDKVTRQNLHFRIDSWQKEMQEIVERTKREQELQQEADAVLWGVRQRKGEAGRQLELLTTLQDLREARVRRRSAAGQPTSAVEIQTFNTVIKRLKALWTRRLSECQLEEQVLRGMLTEAEVTQDAVTTYKKLVLQEWQWAIFGCSSALDTDHNLLDIRRSWDQFAVDEHTVLAAPIPPGWVLPGPPSSQLWKSLLKY